MFERNLLKGKLALVTGGGTGIGLTIARELSFHGAKVIIASRNAQTLSVAADSITSETKNKVFDSVVDVADPDSVDALFKKVDVHGPIDILINGAAANFVRPTQMLTSVRWKKVIDIVLNGTFYCCQEAGRRMLARREGVIVNLVASYAWTGAPGFAPSASAKAGVVALTKTLGVEWASSGVRVNSVCPGLIDTPQSRERLWPEPWMRDMLIDGVPSRQFGKEEDVANAVLYLVSPQTRYVSGEVLVVDGGASTGGVPYLRFLEKAGLIRRKSGSKKA
jgi:NAD(P)-dependent dehydrogenase (short-subunit alcohol dehydrogenase family)